MEHSWASVSQVYIDHVAKLHNAPHVNMFLHWNVLGCKFIVLAAGGSFYILVLLAGLNLKWKIVNSGSRIFWDVAKMLQRPETSSKSCLAPSVLNSSHSDRNT